MLSRFATLGGGGDPYWNNVSFLLVGNGANGTNTNIKDSSSNSITITNTGSTVISTAVSPPAVSNAGSGTVYFNGTTQYLSLATNSVLALGTGDFTVEYWVYHTSFYNYIAVLSAPRSANGFNTGTQGAAQIVWYANGSERVRGTTAMAANTWNHVAFVRYNGTLKGYLNGVQNGTTYADSINYSQNIHTIGCLDGTGEFFTGYLYDLRITKGVARYTADYTPPPFPPTAAFPTS
jgi:hypothetical protein